jgi:hypothetical protein
MKVRFLSARRTLAIQTAAVQRIFLLQAIKKIFRLQKLMGSITEIRYPGPRRPGLTIEVRGYRRRRKMLNAPRLAR